MSREEIISMIQSVPIAQVALETGLSRGVIYRYLRSAGVVRRYNVERLRRWAESKSEVAQ